MKIEFYRHALTEEDFENVRRVLGSTFLTTGPACLEFEEKFQGVTGVRHVVSLNSCTAALHLALLAMGVGKGDEVITTPMTFIATATSVLHTGATPVLVDVEPDTGLIDPEKVENAITSRTKVILPVHLYGAMADMRALREIADRHGLKILEDAAHCIEGERDGIRPGQLSAAVCYSFYATKNLTCGEGGALATNSKELAGRVRTLRQHGMSREACDRYHGIYNHWDMIDLGWKYNLDDIHAALLVSQVDRLPELWLKRERLYKHYRSLCEQVDRLSLPRLAGKSAYHLFTVLVPEGVRDKLLRHLGEKGVGVAVNYRAIHTLTWFRDKFGFRPGDFPHAQSFGAKTISLPFYPELSAAAAETVVSELKKGMQYCLAGQ